MDDTAALKALDIHYGLAFGCPAADLRRAGWTVVAARDDCDPMALLFGKRMLLSLLLPAPLPDVAAVAAPRSGVALVASELRAPVAALLRESTPDVGLGAADIAALTHLITQLAPTSSLEAAHSHIRYTTSATFSPYRGPWQEWIEPLDEAGETDTTALRLLATYSSGAYVVRSEGAIVSYAGVRAQSPYISEITVRTDSIELRGHGLAQAVTSRATKAILAAARLPLYRHPAAHVPSHRVARALGYRFYADALEFVAATQ
ncbi:MAG: hypothetical protein OJF49_001401 [Ktedonobacterales bacterium]|jgi:predicted GNAT family acetyltransferase|nr:MAG: hypothetical protein OJF49_001401 [Ktedonobacterales bacterium]